MLLRIALVISCAAAWSTPRRHPARRAVVAASATDPFRPARGSIAPVAINALSGLDGPADAAHIREVVAGAVARRAGSSAAADADGAFTPDEIAALENALTGVLSSARRARREPSSRRSTPRPGSPVRARRVARARARQRAKEGPPPRARASPSG